MKKSTEQQADANVKAAMACAKKLLPRSSDCDQCGLAQKILRLAGIYRRMNAISNPRR
jgi:hypothetical protein